MGARFHGDIVARNRLDVMIMAGDENCRVTAFDHGRFQRPEVTLGSGTYATTWLDGCEAAVKTWKDALAERGIPSAEGLTVIQSDFLLSDLMEAKDLMPG